MRRRTIIRGASVGIFATVLVSGIIVGCGMNETSAALGLEPASLGVLSARESNQAVTGGAQLWAQNCNRCHNYRAPASLNDQQWKIVLHHMRVRANLTAREHQAILQFLQAAN